MSYKDILWISHSAISSFERCPHLYYLEYRYKNPKTGRRIQIINPYLSLGLSVHEAIEGLAKFSLQERKKISLCERFTKIFEEYSGVKGGFISQKKEEQFKKRGLEMMEKAEKSPFLYKPSTSIKTNFPTVNLQGGAVKLVGNIDWIEVLPDGEAHIVDFKTGNGKENNDSLQLPIYSVLAQHNLDRKIKKVSYWYLQHDNQPVEQKIKNTEHYMGILQEKSLAIKNAIDDNHFPCNYSGNCFVCKDYDKIFQGHAELVSSGINGKKDIFCVFKKKDVLEKVREEDFLDEREKAIFEMRTKKSMQQINKELRLSEEKSQKITEEIKEKLKNNLRNKELKVIINLLQ